MIQSTSPRAANEHPQPDGAETTSPAGSTSSTGSTWVLVLGGLLAAIGLFRAPAHSQQGGGTPNVPPTQTPTVSFPSASHGGSADSNDRMIAVTGVDLTGQSLLYVVDTLNPHVAVYQATGGSPNMQEIKLVAARRIDLDLLLDGFNDRSQHSYKDLQTSFAASGLLPAPAKPKNP